MWHVQAGSYLSANHQRTITPPQSATTVRTAAASPTFSQRTFRTARGGRVRRAPCPWSSARQSPGAGAFSVAAREGSITWGTIVLRDGHRVVQFIAASHTTCGDLDRFRCTPIMRDRGGRQPARKKKRAPQGTWRPFRRLQGGQPPFAPATESRR